MYCLIYPKHVIVSEIANPACFMQSLKFGSEDKLIHATPFRNADKPPRLFSLSTRGSAPR